MDYTVQTCSIGLRPATVPSRDGLTRCESEEIAEPRWIPEGDGNFSGETVHSFKDLIPEITGQRHDEFIGRGSTRLTELFLDGRFKPVRLRHKILSPRRETE